MIASPLERLDGSRTLFFRCSIQRARTGRTLQAYTRRAAYWPHSVGRGRRSRVSATRRSKRQVVDSRRRRTPEADVAVDDLVRLALLTVLARRLDGILRAVLDQVARGANEGGAGGQASARLPFLRAVLSAKAKDVLVGKDLSADELVGRGSKREVIQSASSSTPSPTKIHLAGSAPSAQSPSG
jgi:hypothetical protein